MEQHFLACEKLFTTSAALILSSLLSLLLPAEARSQCKVCSPAAYAPTVPNELLSSEASKASDYLFDSVDAYTKSYDREMVGYHVLDAALFVGDFFYDWVKGVGVAGQRLHNEVRQKHKSLIRKTALDAMKKGLLARPNLSALDSATKQEVIRDGLVLSGALESTSPTDLLQNEVITILAASVTDIESRLAALEESEKEPSSDSLSPEDVVRTNEALNKLDELRNSENAAAESAAAENAPPETKLYLSLANAYEVSVTAANQLGSGASIAAQLGEYELAKTLGRGQAAATVTANLLNLATGNPLAILPALDSALSLGSAFGGNQGSDMAWLADALKQLSEQITQLSRQVERNHREVMASLDHLKFLSEIQRRGIGKLLEGGLSECTRMVPEHWREQAESSTTMVRLDSPLLFRSRDELETHFSSLGAGVWTDCQKALRSQFPVGNIGAAFELALSASIDDGVIASAEKAYKSAKNVLSSKYDHTAPLSAPTPFSGRAFQSNIDVFAPTGGQYFNPLSPGTPLINPIAIEATTGYLLALYPLFELASDNGLISVGDLAEKTTRVVVGKQLLQSALAQINLAIAQQVVLSGAAYNFRDRETLNSEKLYQYTKNIPVAKENLGVILIGQMFYGKVKSKFYKSVYSNERLLSSYMRATYPNLSGVDIKYRDNLVHLWDFQPLVLTNSTYETKEVCKAELRFLCGGKWDSDNPNLRIILPSALDFSPSPPLKLSPAIPRLIAIQYRLIAAIKSFEISDKQGLERLRARYFIAARSSKI